MRLPSVVNTWLPPKNVSTGSPPALQLPPAFCNPRYRRGSDRTRRSMPVGLALASLGTLRRPAPNAGGQLSKPRIAPRRRCRRPSRLAVVVRLHRSEFDAVYACVRLNRQGDASDRTWSPERSQPFRSSSCFVSCSRICRRRQGSCRWQSCRGASDRRRHKPDWTDSKVCLRCTGVVARRTDIVAVDSGRMTTS
jgi:hypothetical protein